MDAVKRAEILSNLDPNSGDYGVELGPPLNIGYWPFRELYISLIFDGDDWSGIELANDLLRRTKLDGTEYAGLSHLVATRALKEGIPIEGLLLRLGFEPYSDSEYL